MNYKGKKARLEEYRRIPEEIKRLREMEKELESEAQRVTAILGGEGTSHSPNAAKLQRCIERMDEVRNKLATAEAEFATRRTEVFNAVAGLSDGRECGALYKHYIQGISITAICFDMHYSRAQVFRLLRSGTEHLNI